LCERVVAVLQTQNEDICVSLRIQIAGELLLLETLLVDAFGWLISGVSVRP